MEQNFYLEFTGVIKVVVMYSTNKLLDDNSLVVDMYCFI